MINPIRSICILRLSAIGDVTHVLPVIATLQKAFPEAKITWIIGQFEYKLLKGLKGVAFILFDKRAGRQGYKDLKTQLNNQTFDVLLHMQYSFRANRAAWKIKAKTRIGFDKKRSRELHGLKLNKRIQAVEKQHVLDSFMEFVKVLGVNELVYEWNITTSNEDELFVKNFIDNNRKNIIISPCSSKKSRNWSTINYAKMIDYLSETHGAHVILCGGPSDFEMDTANEIVKLTNHTVTNITGKDTLKQLYALLKLADLVISPDSGPMHMASAAGTPVIGLHAATTTIRSGAYNYQSLAVDCFDQAARKFLNKSSDKIHWGSQITQDGVMDLVTAEMVIEKIDSVLGTK